MTRSIYGSRNVNIRKKGKRGKTARQARPERPMRGPGRQRMSTGTTKRYRGEQRGGESETDARRAKPAGKRAAVTSGQSRHKGDTERGDQGQRRTGRGARETARGKQKRPGTPARSFRGDRRYGSVVTRHPGRKRATGRKESRGRQGFRDEEPLEVGRPTDRPRSGSFETGKTRRDRSKEPHSDLECIDCGNTFGDRAGYDKHVSSHGSSPRYA